MLYPKVVERRVAVGDTIGQLKLARSYKALVEPDTGAIYGIMSDRYKLIKHEEVIEAVQEAFKANTEYGVPTENITFLKDGARMRTKYTFPEISVNVGNDSGLHPSVEILNSYDGGWRLNVLFGAFRLVCSNGLVIGEKVLHERRLHVGEIDPMYIKEVLNQGMETFSIQKGIWDTWVDRNIEENEKQKLIDELGFSDKQKENLMEEIEVASGETLRNATTLWIVYNIVMQYITHKIKSQMRQVDLMQKARRVFK